MLRQPAHPSVRRLGLALCLAVGVCCGVLVQRGNPGNMGICGACFLRDAGAALGLVAHPAREKLAYLRPELVGLVFGAFLLALGRRRFQARSGSHAASRLLLGAFMGLGALVFLGCPFRMLQRLGGGDLTALAGLLGFVPGVLGGLLLECRGYRLGATAPAPAPVGLQGPALFGVLLVLALTASLHGPAPGSSSPGPARAALALSLGLGVLAGAALSATGYCAVLAARQVVTRPKGMLLGAGALVLGYALVFVLAGTWRAGFEGQPIAHKDAAWSALSMALVGLTGVLAGGCPVRQLVMTGEGNGDALVTSLGILLGGGVAHGLGLASSTSGATPGGKAVVVLGLLWAIAYGVGMLPGAATPSRAGTPVGGA